VAEADRPALVVFDLNNANAKPLTLIPKIKNQAEKGNVDRGLPESLAGRPESEGVEAGCDTVMPRSAFSQTLPNLLRRYGMDEEEDNMPQRRRVGKDTTKGARYERPLLCPCRLYAGCGMLSSSSSIP